MLVREISPLNFNNKKLSNDKQSHVMQQATLATPVTVRPSLANLQAYHTNVSFKAKILPIGIKTGLFKEFAVNEFHPLWEKLITRERSYVQSVYDLRNDFGIDFNRIIHSEAYAKMRGKTQVFLLPKNDMLTTRLTHVEQVDDIAKISHLFGLNEELTAAIARGHDLGHSPFGHSGERKLNQIKQDEGLGTFWHEKNSLKVVDDISLGEKMSGDIENLNLTYAVRDGIVCHCGEIDENGLIPRENYIDLRTAEKTDKLSPITWEGCVMRISDKIAYLGKDIEDALAIGFLPKSKVDELKQLIKQNSGIELEKVNNSSLIKTFVYDLVQNSSPEKGLTFSEPVFNLMNTVKKFNYDNIYVPRKEQEVSYVGLVLQTIYDKFARVYDGKNTLANITKMKEHQNDLAGSFEKWLINYSDIAPEKHNPKMKNNSLYSMDNEKDYKTAIIDFIANMTDKEAVNSFNSIMFPY